MFQDLLGVAGLRSHTSLCLCGHVQNLRWAACLAVVGESPCNICGLTVNVFFMKTCTHFLKKEKSTLLTFCFVFNSNPLRLSL